MEAFGTNQTEQDISNLFCPPQVLAALMEGCLGEAAVEELAEIVLRDGALAAKVLLAASKTSPHPLNPSEPVTAAVDQLGTTALATLALQAGREVVRYQFTPQELSFQYGLWFSSRIAGLFARCLAPSVNYPRIEEAQLCGLLLNSGIQALFARNRTAYLELAVNPWSSLPQSALEMENCGIDHLTLGDALIREWNLRSFLADAVRFLSADLLQLGQSGQLLKIARLVQQLSESPQQLTQASETLAEQFFGLRQSEIAYLFDWAQGLYPAYGRLLNDVNLLQAELTTDLQRMTELSFLLADQEAARARLAGCATLDELLSATRNLYLENSSVSDAVFFLFDQKNHNLTAVATPEQPELIGEMTIPLTPGAAVVANTLLDNCPCDTFAAGGALTVSDQILIRLCQSRGLSCYPLLAGGKKLGAVVLGVDSEGAARSTRFAMLTPVVSRALAGMSNRVDDYFVESSSLLRRVSHEVNEPLTVIGNYAGVLSQMLAAGEGSEMAGSIKEEARRIDDILNYYLNQQELPDFPEHRIDLNHLLRDTVAALEESEIKSRQIEIQFELQNDLHKIATNPLLVKQILLNLIKNSVEALSGGGTIQVLSRDGYASDWGRYVEIVVRDNGPGLPAAIGSQLFKPVVSTKGAGHSGVGLSIVKGMIDDLGGRISCHSSPGSGTSFHIQLPDADG